MQGGDILAAGNKRPNKLQGVSKRPRLHEEGTRRQLEGQAVTMALAGAELAGTASPLWARLGHASVHGHGSGPLGLVVLGLLVSSLVVLGMRARRGRRGGVMLSVPEGYVSLSALDTAAVSP